MRKPRELVRSLYHGASPRSRRFRAAMLGFDLAIFLFFIATTLQPESSLGMGPHGLRALEMAIAAIITLDVLARLWIAPNRARFLVLPTTLIDVVIVTTLVIPWFVDSLIFLRVLRAVGLLRSIQTLRDLRAQSRFFRDNEDVIQSAVNLIVFIFVMSSLVFVFQGKGRNSEIENFIDALYFTVSTLTTTGFGDITLKGDWGHLLSVVVMALGVSLFLRLLQTIFRPRKVAYTCPNCGLQRHEPDASHCKHCGHVIFIATDGD